LARFTSELVSEEELSEVRSALVGRLPLSLESNAGTASALLNLERYQRGLDYIPTALQICGCQRARTSCEARLIGSRIRWSLLRGGSALMIKCGVDIVKVERLDAINPAIRARFIRRVFTPLEQTQLGAQSDALAGVFAAKEAPQSAGHRHRARNLAEY
jgi:hypothetical protein